MRKCLENGRILRFASAKVRRGTGGPLGFRGPPRCLRGAPLPSPEAPFATTAFWCINQENSHQMEGAARNNRSAYRRIILDQPVQQQAGPWDEPNPQGWSRSSDGKYFSKGGVILSLTEHVLRDAHPYIYSNIPEHRRHTIATWEWSGDSYALHFSPNDYETNVAIDAAGNRAYDFNFIQAAVTSDTLNQSLRNQLYFEGRKKALKRLYLETEETKVKDTSASQAAKDIRNIENFSEKRIKELCKELGITQQSSQSRKRTDEEIKAKRGINRRTQRKNIPEANRASERVKNRAAQEKHRANQSAEETRKERAYTAAHKRAHASYPKDTHFAMLCESLSSRYTNGRTLDPRMLDYAVEQKPGTREKRIIVFDREGCKGQPGSLGVGIEATDTDAVTWGLKPNRLEKFKDLENEQARALSSTKSVRSAESAFGHLDFESTVPSGNDPRPPAGGIVSQFAPQELGYPHHLQPLPAYGSAARDTDDTYAGIGQQAPENEPGPGGGYSAWRPTSRPVKGTFSSPLQPQLATPSSGSIPRGMPTPRGKGDGWGRTR
jgi:hypothetical protein